MCGGVLGPQLLVFLRGYRIKLICGYSELGSTFIKIVRVCDGAVNKIRGVFFCFPYARSIQDTATYTLTTFI
jgi:hypothetical protein